MPTKPAPPRGRGGALSRQQVAAYWNRADRRRYGQGRDLSRSLEFAAADGSMGSASALVGIADEWTVGAWVRPRTQANRSFLGVGTAAANGIGLGINTDESLRAINYASGGGFLKLYNTPANSFPLDEWAFVGARWDGTVLSLFINGEYVPDADLTKSTDNAGSMTDTARTITVGAGSGTFQNGLLEGEVNQAFVTDALLSQDAIRELYFGGRGRLVDMRYPFGAFAQPHSLKHYYRFGEDAEDIGRDYGRAVVLHDTSNGNYDGTDLVVESPL